MALWSVKLGEETRSGLTVYQLQELIRTGQVTAENEVFDGAEWKRVVDVPALARSLPETLASSLGGARKVVIHGLELEIGEDGKPKPLPPEVIAQMLASQSTRRTDPERAKKVNRTLIVVVSVVIIVMMAMILRQMTLSGQL